jgi:hypothetical protein
VGTEVTGAADGGRRATGDGRRTTGNGQRAAGDGDSADLEHDERDREPAHAVAEDHQDAGHFPTDEAALKLLYLAIRNIQLRWAPSPEWRAALPHLVILFGDRFAPET